MSLAQVKVPAIIVSSVLSFLLGIALTVPVMVWIGYDPTQIGLPQKSARSYNLGPAESKGGGAKGKDGGKENGKKSEGDKGGKEEKAKQESKGDDL